jgi:hypothetical protein
MAWTRQGIKAMMLRIRPTSLVAVIVVAILVVVGLTAAIDANRRPQAAPATVRSIDDELAKSLSADEQGLVDSDRDGLSDTLENFVYGTNPDRYNTSGSRIPDGWLTRYGLDPFDPAIETESAARPPFGELPPSYRATWPAAFRLTLWDVYAFGRPDNWSEEVDGPFDSGLDPTDWDNNEDEIPDAYLLHYDLDPLEEGIGDKRLAGPQGLTVRNAYEHGTNPRMVDTDADGLSDAEEIAGALGPEGRRMPASDPLRFSTSGTLVCDGYLARRGLDPNQPASALGDPDLDGATTRDEYNWSASRFGATNVCSGTGGLNPTRSHSGTSTLLDGWLIRFLLNPLEPDIEKKETQRAETDLRPTLPAPAAGCPVGLDVTLTVYDEYNHSRPADWDEAKRGPWNYGTDPTKADTDADGFGDAFEARGYCITAVPDPIQNLTRVYRTTSDPTKSDSRPPPRCGPGRPRTSVPSTRSDATPTSTASPTAWKRDWPSGSTRRRPTRHTIFCGTANGIRS